MPRNPVVNRRNLESPLRQRSLEISDEARAQLRGTAAKLSVSQGSLVDTAVRELMALPLETIAGLLYDHGHLDGTAFAYVTRLARGKDKGE